MCTFMSANICSILAILIKMLHVSQLHIVDSLFNCMVFTICNIVIKIPIVDMELWYDTNSVTADDICNFDKLCNSQMYVMKVSDGLQLLLVFITPIGKALQNTAHIDSSKLFKK